MQTKEGWLVVLGQEGLCEGWGNCLKYLKREWNRKEGRGSKDLKKGGGVQVGSRGGRLKKKGGWNPLTNYGCIHSAHAGELSSLLVDISNFNKTEDLSGNQALNKNSSNSKKTQKNINLI